MIGFQFYFVFCVLFCMRLNFASIDRQVARSDFVGLGTKITFGNEAIIAPTNIQNVIPNLEPQKLIARLLGRW